MIPSGAGPERPGKEAGKAREGKARRRVLTSRRLMIALGAASFAQVITAAHGPGVSGAEIEAVTQVIGAFGGGAMSIAMMDYVEKLRRRRSEGAELTAADIQDEITSTLEQALPADIEPETLDFGIAQALQQVDRAQTLVAALRDIEDDPVARAELISVLAALDDSYPLTRAVLRDGLAEIQENQARDSRSLHEIRTLLTEIQQDIQSRAHGKARRSPGPVRRSGGPYLGLNSFRETDSAVFYGRERLTAELADQLTDRERRGVLIVTGASGSGKTSLLHAGLLPALAQGGRIAGSQLWPRQVIIPSANPLGQLGQVLAGLTGDSPKQVRRRLAARPHAAAAVVKQALDRYALHNGRTAGGGRLVLIIDQFESIFDLDLDAAATADYLSALHSAAAESAEPGAPPPAMIAVAIRSDRLGRCIAHAELGSSAKAGMFIVEPMDAAELRRAITRPAVRAGLSLEDGLVEDVLDEVSEVPTDSILPLLSEAMRATWTESAGGQLTREAYCRGGGVKGAVERSAEAVYKPLSQVQQTLAREILIGMTGISAGRPVRRPSTLAQIAATHPGDEAGVRAVVGALSSGRLIVVGAEHVEIVHDVLLDVWPRLKEWIDEDLENFVLYRQLREGAELWAGQRESRDYLFQGSRLGLLTQAIPTWPRGRYPLTDTDREFLTASKRVAARRTHQRRLLAGILVALTAVSLGGVFVAIDKAATASQQRQIALSAQFAALSQVEDSQDPVTAAQLATVAWRESRTPQARLSLLQVLAQPVRAVLTTGSPTAVAFSPRHDVLATAGKDIVFWSLATDRRIGAPLTVPGGAAGLAFNSDGSVLATADNDGTIRLWDVLTRREIGPAIVASTRSAVNAVVFSPAGGVLATADGDGTARLWNTATHREIGRPLADGPTASRQSVADVAFSPDGKLIATASFDGTARLWDVAAQRPIGHAMTSKETTPIVRRMVAVTFSPRGTVLATADRAGNLTLWDVATQRPAGPPMTAKAGANAISFAPDGLALAVADSAGAAEVWDIANRTINLPVLNAVEAGAVTAVAFSPDSGTLATVSSNHTVRLWDLTRMWNITAPVNVGDGVAVSRDALTIAGIDAKGVLRLWNLVTGRAGPSIQAGQAAEVDSAALSPDGQLLAIGNYMGTVQLWNARTGQRIGRAIKVTTTGAVGAVAFSPNGQFLATGDDNGAVRLWSVKTGQAVGRPAPAAPAAVYALTFSPHGGLLAITSTSGSLRLWNTISGSYATLNIPVTVDGAAFSPDGKLLATADADGTARLWTLPGGQQYGTPMVASELNAVTDVVFSPDGRTLATAGFDGYAGLWDVTTQGEIGIPRVGGAHISGLSMVAFSSNGRLLATVADDGISALWNIDFPPDLYDAACALAGGPLPRHDWSSYVQSAPYLAGCQ